MQKIYTSLLHYKAYPQLRLTLKKLSKLSVPKKFSLTTVVVDNASDEPVLKKLKKQFPKVVFLPQKENTGATVGFNIGYKYGISHNADFLIMLSPDLELKPDALKKMIEVLVEDRDKKIGIVSCKMLMKTNPRRIFFVQGLLDSRTKTPIHIGLGEIDRGQYDKTKYNDFLNCPMIIRKEVFKKIGYFEPKLFMYYEDTDWHARIREGGFQLVCVKNAIAWNNQPDRDSLLRPKKEYYLSRNHLWFAKKHFSFFEQLIVYFYTIREILLIFLGSNTQNKKRLPYIFLGVKDFFFNKMGKRDFLD